MADKFLIDVNVCLDVLLERNPFWNDAAVIFQAAENKQIRGLVSAISFDTMFYVLRSDIGAARAQLELKRFRQHIYISTVDGTVVDNALAAGWCDLEDAVQYYSAIFSDCKAVITRNKKDYPIDEIRLPVLSPTEFISEYL